MPVVVIQNPQPVTVDAPFFMKEITFQSILIRDTLPDIRRRLHPLCPLSADALWCTLQKMTGNQIDFTKYYPRVLPGIDPPKEGAPSLTGSQARSKHSDKEKAVSPSPEKSEVRIDIMDDVPERESRTQSGSLTHTFLQDT